MFHLLPYDILSTIILFGLSTWNFKDVRAFIRSCKFVHKVYWELVEDYGKVEGFDIDCRGVVFVLKIHGTETHVNYTLRQEQSMLRDDIPLTGIIQYIGKNRYNYSRHYESEEMKLKIWILQKENGRVITDYHSNGLTIESKHNGEYLQVTLEQMYGNQIEIMTRYGSYPDTVLCRIFLCNEQPIAERRKWFLKFHELLISKEYFNCRGPDNAFKILDDTLKENFPDVYKEVNRKW